MTYTLDLVAMLWALSGIVVGLAVGSLTWGRAARRHKRAAESVANAAAAAAARTRAGQSERELAAAQSAMRPMADEIDRLKRELAKVRRPVQEPLPGMTPQPLTPQPLTPLPPLDPLPPLGTAVAGTGPLVVDPGATYDVRQLKGVGDKFATALGAIGLGTVDALARLNPDEAVDADTRLGVFNGRIAKDQLVDQAVLLDEGRTTEYEARFGKLGGPVLV